MATVNSKAFLHYSKDNAKIVSTKLWYINNAQNSKYLILLSYGTGIVGTGYQLQHSTEKYLPT